MSALRRGMSLSASEFYEAGMSLPPSVRKDMALRLLESVDPDAGVRGLGGGLAADRGCRRLRRPEGGPASGPLRFELGSLPTRGSRATG